MQTSEFLGHPIDFWIEIRTKIDMLDDPKLVTKLILENRQLRGKVEYINRRLDEFKTAVQGDL